MGPFRSAEMYERYKAERGTVLFKTACALCSREPVRTYTHWKLIENKFPYDLMAGTHHMLVPLRHAPEIELTKEEQTEFLDIKYSDDIQHTYDNFIESTHRTRSIHHFHLHLVVLKEPHTAS